MKKRYRVMHTPSLCGSYYTVQQREWFWWIDLATLGSEETAISTLEAFVKRDEGGPTVVFDTAWTRDPGPL